MSDWPSTFWLLVKLATAVTIYTATAYVMDQYMRRERRKPNED